MLEWLQNHGGYTSNGLTIDEKKELENLRLEVRKYRQLEEGKKLEKIQSIEEQSDSENQSESSENNEDEDPAMGDLTKNEMPKKKVKHRTGVSAEVYGEYNKKEDFVPRKIPKTDEQIIRIKTSIIHSFLFSNLEAKDLQIVIDAFEEKTFKKGEDVIVQGDQGDCLYFVESGNLDCKIKFNKEAEPVVVKKYQGGDAFGELALLYNAPRAATITTTSDEAITWMLDRETFNNIVKDSARKKREKYEEFLKKVEILSEIDPYELMQICDAVKTASFKQGDYIMREGEVGDVFYILEEGEAQAMKTLEAGKPETCIKEYKIGDYFGERALIRGEPRYCSIVVKSEFAKVISLDRDGFRRLLGPIQDILQRNMEKYETFIVKGSS